jgi:DNA-directed RNA polymerase specialized sigma24 family protein
MSRWDDPELSGMVKRILQKDSAVFTRFFERTYQKIYFLSLALTRDEKQSAAVVGSTYQQALAQAQNGSGSNTAAWLAGIAYQQILSSADGRGIGDPLSANVTNENVHAMMTQISSLPLEQKAAVILSHYMGMDMQEIAAVQKCTPDVASQVLSTAEQTLGAGSEDGDPVKAALDSTARTVAMGRDDAFNILVSALSGAGFDTDVSEFTPAPDATFENYEPKGKKRSLVGTIVLILVAIALALVVTFLILSWTPVITDVSYDKTMTNKNVPVTVTLKSNSGVAQVYATSDDKNFISAEKQADGTYVLAIPANGDYKLTVEGNNGKSALQNFTISNIDTTGPEITSSGIQNDVLTLTYKDAASGLDMNSAYALDSTGNKVLPTSTDAATGTVIYDMTTAKLAVFLSDSLGNAMEYDITKN